jgi:hypothetical protein
MGAQQSAQKFGQELAGMGNAFQIGAGQKK